MTPLVSIVCPSRHRVHLLYKMIRSIADTADDPTRIEFCIRLHSDDKESLHEIGHIVDSAPNVRIAVGPPMDGWNDLSRFYEEAIALAKGKWIWVMNDDVVCETKGWDRMVAEETHDTILMPETHKLGLSTYKLDIDCPFMWVPNGCWKQYLFDAPLPTPFDCGLWGLLRANGWPTRHIPVTVHHQRSVTAHEDIERAKWEKINPEEQCRH